MSIYNLFKFKKPKEKKRFISIVIFREPGGMMATCRNKYGKEEFFFPLNIEIHPKTDPLEMAQGLVADSMSSVIDGKKAKFEVKKNEFLEVVRLHSEEIFETVYALKLHDERFDGLVGKREKVTRILPSAIINKSRGHFVWLFPLALSSYGATWNVPDIHFNMPV